MKFFDKISVSRANRRLRYLARMFQAKSTDPRLLMNAFPWDVEAVQKCLDEGATLHKEPGFLDTLTRYPEVASLLMEHGAVPGEDFIHALCEGAMANDRFFSFTDATDLSLPPKTAEQWQRRMLLQAIELAPGLDWLCPLPRDRDNAVPVVLAERLDVERKGVLAALLQARLDHAIPLVPFSMSKQDLDACLVQLSSPNPTFQSYWENADELHGAIFGDLLGQGANPSVSWGESARFHQSFCLLAHLMSHRQEWVAGLLKHHPVVSESELVDVGKVIVGKYLGHPTPQLRQCVELILEHVPPSIDLEALMVPMLDPYMVPTTCTFASIVHEMFPKEDLIDQARTKIQADDIASATIPIAPVASRPRMRL